MDNDSEFVPETDDNRDFLPPLHRGQSIALMDKADEFAAQKSKRERAILINVVIDQGKTVGQLLQMVREMRGINLVGTVKAGKVEIELTKSLLYVQKDAKKQATTLMFEDQYTLEDIRVMDRQGLIITEVLTDYAKLVIQDHY